MAGLIIEPIIFIRYNSARCKSLASMILLHKRRIEGEKPAETIFKRMDISGIMHPL
jgi:hypothetical protein